jgi:hypothetical protein
MHAVRRDEDDLLREFVEQMNGAGERTAARDTYRDGFRRLRSRWVMYPPVAESPSATFESVATTMRELAASCLPLAIAVAMHLYPLCALQCVPVPLLSAARFQRAMLLRTIRSRSLILANAGSDRVDGAHAPLIATRVADGIRVDGTYEYMSLASVADIVLFKAQLADSSDTVLCAADLRGDSVRIGDWKFTGSMRLSDTASVTFTGHRIPRERYVVMASNAGFRCVSDYQRCWFHLFLVEMHLARIDRLHRIWGLVRSAEHFMSLNELSRLREYSLRLLDEFSTRGRDIRSLMSTTAAMKLRTSMLAQSTIAVLRELTVTDAYGAQQLQADASELSYIRSQPTADRQILCGLGACTDSMNR